MTLKFFSKCNQHLYLLGANITLLSMRLIVKKPTMWDKKKKRYCREMAALAHERELNTALQALQSQFENWQQDKIDCFELNQLVHEFHDGISLRSINDIAWVKCTFQLFSR
jgi:hypothetical protein